MWYALHEVYYNDEGVPITYAEEPEVVGDNIQDLVESIELMLKDTKAHQKAIGKGKKYYQEKKGKPKSKIILEEKDFEKGGAYFAAQQEWEQEIKINTLALPRLPIASFPKSLGIEAGSKATNPTNEKRNSKNARRKPRTRNTSTRK